MQPIAEQSVVTVIDVQGKLATLMQHASDLSSNIAALLEASQLLTVPALWVEQAPEKLGVTIPPIANKITTLYPTLKPIVKSSFSTMGCQEFKQTLQSLQRKQVILVGIESHICVYQTARDLVAQGYEVFAVIDGISSRTNQNYQLGLSRMEQLGVTLTSVEMLVFEWQQAAEGKNFSKIAKLFR